MPRLFLIVTLSSIGLPGLNGFVGEFLILLGTFGVNHRARRCGGYGSDSVRRVHALDVSTRDLGRNHE